MVGDDDLWYVGGAMHPEPLVIPGTSYRVEATTVAIVIAVAVSIALAVWWANRREGLRPGRTLAGILLLTVGEFVGGRAHFVAAHWSAYAATPLVALRPWPIHAGGAAIGILLSALLVPRLVRLPLGKFVDALAPAAGLGIAIARIGCLMHGCCFGAVCGFPWCMSFPPGSTVQRFHASLGLVADDAATRSLPVHPLQLYFAGAGLALSALAVWTYRRRRYDGQVALVCAAFFALTSAALEFFRADWAGRGYWGPLPQLEWIAIGLSLAVLAALTVAELSYADRKPEAPRPLAS